jgi:hypothetical protein
MLPSSKGAIGAWACGQGPCGAGSEGADQLLGNSPIDKGGKTPAYQGVRRGMKIFHLSWWVLPMVSVGTAAVIAAVAALSQALMRRNRSTAADMARLKVGQRWPSFWSGAAN